MRWSKLDGSSNVWTRPVSHRLKSELLIEHICVGGSQIHHCNVRDQGYSFLLECYPYSPSTSHCDRSCSEYCRAPADFSI